MARMVDKLAEGRWPPRLVVVFRVQRDWANDRQALGRWVAAKVALPRTASPVHACDPTRHGCL